MSVTDSVLAIFTVMIIAGLYLCAVVLVMCCCSILSVGGDGMFAEVVHGLLTNVLRASGSDQPSVDTVLPQPKWRIGIIPAGMQIFPLSSVANEHFGICTVDSRSLVLCCV